MINSTSGIGGLSVADPSQNSSSPKFSIPDDFATTAATIDGLAINSFLNSSNSTLNDSLSSHAHLPFPPNSSDFSPISLMNNSDASGGINGIEGTASSSLTAGEPASTKEPRTREERKENEFKQMEAQVSNLKAKNLSLQKENELLKKRILELESNVGLATQPIFTNLASPASSGLEELWQSSNARPPIGYEDRYGFFPSFEMQNFVVPPSQSLLPNPTDRSLWQSDNQAPYSASTLLPTLNGLIEEPSSLSHLNNLNKSPNPMTSNAEFGLATWAEQPISSTSLPLSNQFSSSETSNGIDEIEQPQNGLTFSFNLQTTDVVQTVGTAIETESKRKRGRPKKPSQPIPPPKKTTQRLSTEEKNMRLQASRALKNKEAKENIQRLEQENSHLEERIDNLIITYNNFPQNVLDLNDSPSHSENQQISAIQAYRENILHPLKRRLFNPKIKEKPIKEMTHSEILEYEKKSKAYRKKMAEEYKNNLTTRNTKLKQMVDDLSKINETSVLRFSESTGTRPESENQQ